MTELATTFFGGYTEGTPYLCALLKSGPRFIGHAVAAKIGIAFGTATKAANAIPNPAN